MTITSFRISEFPLIKLSFEKGIKQSVEVLDLSFRVFNVYAKIKRTPDIVFKQVLGRILVLWVVPGVGQKSKKEKFLEFFRNQNQS